MKKYLLELTLALAALFSYVREIYRHGADHIVGSTVLFLVIMLLLLACMMLHKRQNKEKADQQEFDDAIARISRGKETENKNI